MNLLAHLGANVQEALLRNKLKICGTTNVDTEPQHDRVGSVFFIPLQNLIYGPKN